MLLFVLAGICALLVWRGLHLLKRERERGWWLVLLAIVLPLGLLFGWLMRLLVALQ
jgi:hypothetical protein